MIFPTVLLLAASLVSATPLLASDLASEDLQPANKSTTYWACPEYGLGYYGFDITQYENIDSWQECGKGSLQIRIDENSLSRHSPPSLIEIELF